MKTKMVFSNILGKNVDVPAEENDSPFNPLREATIQQLVANYKLGAIRLKDYRDYTFKRDSRVRVNDPRFTGVGIVACQYDTDPDKLAVLLENGNVWWYPIENCTPIDTPNPPINRSKGKVVRLERPSTQRMGESQSRFGSVPNLASQQTTRRRKATMSKTAFRKELCNLINRESMENGSDTPDFLLAEYLSDCLEVFDRTTTAREKWYGRDKKPAPSYECPQSDLPPHENEEPDDDQKAGAK